MKFRSISLNQTLNYIIRFKFQEFHWSFISHLGTIVLMYMYWHRKWVSTSSSRFNFTILSQKVNIVKKNHRDIFSLAVCSIENSNNMIYLKDFFWGGGGINKNNYTCMSSQSKSFDLKIQLYRYLKIASNKKNKSKVQTWLMQIWTSWWCWCVWSSTWCASDSGSTLLRRRHGGNRSYLPQTAQHVFVGVWKQNKNLKVRLLYTFLIFKARKYFLAFEKKNKISVNTF